MRAYKWISTLLALCLLLALVPGSLAEAADEYCAELEEFDLAAPEDVRAVSPPEADMPKAGGSEVPLKDYNFPDASFRSYLEKNVDTDGSGTLSDAEINDVVMLDLSGLLIYDLKGIEFFPVLSRLYCSNNQLSSLDLSGNPSLTRIACDDNQLSSLDVSKCTALEYLYCDSNQLTSLDASGCTELTELNCSYNQLTSLNPNSSTALTGLRCNNNQLTSLNVSNNTALTSLYCYSNQLTSLNVSNNTALTSLYCNSNLLT